jgi:hypothetical protein
MVRKAVYFLSVILAAFISNTAQATLVDFEADSPLYVAQTVISSNSFEFSNPFATLWKFSSDHPYYGESYSGANNQTTFLAFSSGSSPLNITQIGGGAFNLSSLDLGLGYFNVGMTAMVNLSGSLVGGGVISQSFEINHSFQTFNLGFANLASLSITSSASGYLVADNINVTAVPEPETYALIMLGLGLIGVTANRRRKQQV